MRSGNFPQKFLVPLILLVLRVALIEAGNLEFYQDVEPERPMDVNYDEMARYLEAQKHTDMRDVSTNELSANLPWPYIEYLYYRRQKEKKILEALLENPSLLDALRSSSRRTKERESIEQQSPFRYGIPPDESIGFNDPAETHPYTVDRFNDNTNLRTPYAKNIFANENNKPRYFADTLSGYPLKMSPMSNVNYPLAEDENEAVGSTNLGEKLLKINHENHGNPADDETSKNIEREPKVPEFTFKFDETKINERDTFAIRPNDPRYYEPDRTMITESAAIFDEKKTTTNQAKSVPPFRGFLDEDETRKNDYIMPKTYTDHSTENIRNDKFSIMKIISPEVAHRRTDHDSVIVSSSRVMSNDIYFIAIVAGCSAAAMFALVLISLTWCRLQRGAKAAADIEYPAYGVTGPNKDISPSGDQRLAHSAQMYHFQHQKQQIIAMENRTAASRDPGSVSEAESDEENEEGDYTVYECPGLASTGEMEVKNPMFHDDPTPATPPQIHKEGDHI